MINLHFNSKIYVLLHTKEATGGSELLHQLVYHLRNSLNLEAYVYWPFDQSDPIHRAYKAYSNPVVFKIEDKNDNLLIYPEGFWTFSIVARYKSIRKTIWWLSVDNFYLSFILNSKKNLFLPRAINKLTFLLFKRRIFDIQEIAYRKIRKNQLNLNKFNTIRDADYHFVQSYYALKHLEERGIEKNKVFYLSDYLNKDFLKTQTDLSKKENIVAYNPKKGFDFTRKIISSAKDIKFIPLINMTRDEVIKTLQRAKVYIDFGNHPGKDRIPREAAILGCCVITGKRGSAAFFEDVPISNEYKFEDKEENIPKIIEKIKDCFKNFWERYKDFNYYRQMIKNEPQKFIEDLKKIFVKVEKWPQNFQ
jgi:hypothetical protein